MVAREPPDQQRKPGLRANAWQVVVATTAALAWPAGVTAQSAVPHLRSLPLRIIVASSAGSGSDITAATSPEPWAS